ncbi:MAG: hypothetical protein JW754_01545 [Candidatus Aenigmarchaeota archaeon]|nr:hypothetical protein [Candidatus Aenigmarchaeota archaeon]
MHIIFSPIWFMGIDSIFEILSAIIAIFVGFYAFKIYRSTRKKDFFYLFIAFAMLFFAFIVRSFTDLAAYSLFLESIPIITKIVQVQYVYYTGIYTYQLLTLLGYLTLAILALKIRGRRVISLLVMFVIISSVMSLVSYSAFHMIAAVMLSYVVLHFYENCSRKFCKNSLLVFVSFLLIFLSQVIFIFIFHTWFYVLGQVLQFLGYFLLLANLILVYRS